MKSTINNQELLKALKKVAIGIKTNPVIPILSSVLFKFTKNKLLLTATDLETTYMVSLDCECKTEFSFTMEHRDITDVCSTSVAPIEISLSEKTINIISGKAKHRFTVSGDTNTFPLIPEDDFDFEINADADFFFNLSCANDFRSKDDTRVNMNMAALRIHKTKIYIVATDNYAFFEKTIKCKNKKEMSVMVCSVFCQACKGFNEGKIYIGEKFIKVECENDVIISRLSEYKFVNYEVGFPSDINYNLTIDKEELKLALNQAVITSWAETKECTLLFKKDGIVVTSQNIDSAKESDIPIDIKHGVNMEKIAFNSAFMGSLLNHLEGHSVDMSFTAPNKSIFIKPTEDDSVKCLLQPIFINE